MNIELYNKMNEVLLRLKKEKRAILRELKLFRENEDYLSVKGKLRLISLNNRLEEIESELKGVQEDYQSYEELSEKVKELSELVKSEINPKVKKTLEELYNEKLELLESSEEMFKKYYFKEAAKEASDKNNKKEEGENKEAQKASNKEGKKPQNASNKEGKKPQGTAKSNEVSKKVKRVGLSALALGTTALAVLGISRGCSKTDKSNSYDSNSIEYLTPNPTEIPQSTETIEIVQSPNPTEIPQSTETPKAENAMLDATDIDEVYDRAEKIYSEFSYLDEIDHNYKGREVQTIANLIRVLNGELPLNEDRETIYSPTSLDDNLSAMVDIMDNYPSSPQLDENSKSYYSDLVAWDEEVYNFAKKYDEVYANISDARNNDDFEAFENNVQTLGKLLYEDWVMNGANTGVNPYGFAATQRYLALSSSIGRYSSSVIEYASERGAVICVDVCYDYETGELKEVKVSDIYEAIRDGVRNDATLDIFLPDGEYLIELGFYNDLAKELEFKYENTLSYTLK